MQQKTVSNKKWRGHALGIASEILLVLLLAGNSCAAGEVGACKKQNP